MTRPTDPLKVIRAVPRTGRNDLYHTMDGYDWVYENPAYTKVDCAKPGFFNNFRDELRVGAVVECRLGSIQAGIVQTWVQVIAVPKTEGEGDVMVSVGASRKFTPCRHGGGLEKEEGKAA